MSKEYIPYNFTETVVIGDLVQEKYYYGKGVQVDIHHPDKPIILLENQLSTSVELLLAVRMNATGFWDQATQTFKHTHINTRDIFDKSKHTVESVYTETQIMQELKKKEELQKYVPWVFPTRTDVLITEFCEGPTLREIIKANNCDFHTRLTISIQLIDFLNSLTNKYGFFHNDFHARNVILQPSGNIKVLDYQMTDTRRKAQDTTYSDLSHLNKMISRLLNNGDKTKREIDISVIPQPYKEILKLFPFTEETFSSTEFQRGMTAVNSSIFC